MTIILPSQGELGENLNDVMRPMTIILPSQGELGENLNDVMRPMTIIFPSQGEVRGVFARARQTQCVLATKWDMIPMSLTIKKFPLATSDLRRYAG